MAFINHIEENQKNKKDKEKKNVRKEASKWFQHKRTLNCIVKGLSHNFPWCQSETEAS